MSHLPCFCGIVALRNTLSVLAVKTLSNMTHILWGQISQHTRNSVPCPLAEGVAGVWAHLLGAVLGLGAPLHLHCSFHCHLVRVPLPCPFLWLLLPWQGTEPYTSCPAPCGDFSLLVSCSFSSMAAASLKDPELTKPPSLMFHGSGRVAMLIA